jgi:hypothetical protein
MRLQRGFDYTSENIVTDLINALPGNSFVNTNTGNSIRETVFYAIRAEQKHGAIGSLFPGNADVNMHPRRWETVFSVGSMQRSYLLDEQRYESVLSSLWKIATESSS